MALTSTPTSDRPFYTRLTVIGGFILAVINYLEAQDMIPLGTATNIANLVENGAALLAAFGLYRHIPTT